MALAACSSDGEEIAVRTTTTSTERTTTTASTALPQFSGDPGSPFCELLRNVDPTTILAGDPEDAATVEAGFRRLVGVLHDAQALAPVEIDADLMLVTEGIAALDATLAEVGYDFDALAASGQSAAVTEAVNDPAFTAAGERLGAYRTQVCHL